MTQKKYKTPRSQVTETRIIALHEYWMAPAVASRVYTHRHGELVTPTHMTEVWNRNNLPTLAYGGSRKIPMNILQKVLTESNNDHSKARELLGVDSKTFDRLQIEYCLASPPPIQERQPTLRTTVDYTSGHKRGNGRGSSSKKKTIY